MACRTAAPLPVSIPFDRLLSTQSDEIGRTASCSPAGQEEAGTRGPVAQQRAAQVPVRF